MLTVISSSALSMLDKQIETARSVRTIFVRGYRPARRLEQVNIERR